MKDAKFRGCFYVYQVYDVAKCITATMLHGIVTELQRNNGFSIATNKELAEKLHTSIRTVQNKLDLLEQLGLLEIKQFQGKRILTAKEPGGE